MENFAYTLTKNTKASEDSVARLESSASPSSRSSPYEREIGETGRAHLDDVAKGERRYEIDGRLAIRQGMYRGIARTYGVSEDAVSGHVAVEYISQLNALAADAERAVRTDSLLDRIEAFLSRTLGVLEATEETGELGRCCLGGSAPPRRLNSVGSFNREVLMLNEIKKWTPSQLKAIYWFATPKVERKPRFQKEFAETLGVREETISRWKNDPDLSAEVGRVARAELGKDLPEVYGTLRKMAIRGSFQHMKLYLELLEEHREEVDINFIDKRRKLREELLELERKRRENAPPRGLGRADEAS